MLQADPQNLRYAASRLSAGASELRRLASRAVGYKTELVTTNWRGTASQAFDQKAELQAGYLRKTADALEKAVPALNQLANHIDSIMDLRRRAEQFEQASWEYGGDSIDDLHHRQNLARQAASLRQQAEWEANQADAAAASQFHEILSLIPGVGDLLNQHHEMPTTTLADIKRQDDIHETLIEAIFQFYKSKQSEDWSDAERSETASQYLIDTNKMSSQDLYNMLEKLLSDDERAAHYQKLIQDHNFDADAYLENDAGYKGYVFEQAFQSESPGSTAIAGIQFAVFTMKALLPKFQADRGASTNGVVHISGEGADWIGQRNPVWLSDNFKVVNFKGSVKVNGETRDVSRKVYQNAEIDWEYVDPNTGLTNRERAKMGNAPIGPDGFPIELHHTIQKEPGPMVELTYTQHKQYYSTLHGLIEDGNSFRNNGMLEKQYNNFRAKYWRWRANQLD
ncbi:HNH/ENDO VII family nuclease [Tumebacillus flagellatus]|uniref:LHH domain-containing protein n=1 Tax=Tumebacillus flagellatus TaxID=1157490 RepID=A0A074LJP0_9BACL|nr:HNH/ENDO VII family nuclease [Tumebacillus flagellatus]KEO80820.1 hypothetical protein EL26_24255 [Tumebacillus flagellatus]